MGLVQSLDNTSPLDEYLFEHWEHLNEYEKLAQKLKNAYSDDDKNSREECNRNHIVQQKHLSESAGVILAEL
jgi:hypothetical protein